LSIPKGANLTLDVKKTPKGTLLSSN